MLQLLALVYYGQMMLARIKYATKFQFLLEGILIHFLGEATAKDVMHLHGCADNLIYTI